ncbi:hypothetical protein VHUM_03089 [Vanrija humicola]|uniref:Polysaccharide lyase family 8 protein n=1 Tax=Vanrija humicola TaxID=5417 RepID=A0A7D8V0J9_VANHU|nr:hypothetical protein VHUM_03089 [Vanrija humicola]
MAGFSTGPQFAQIDTWLGSQTANGTWPDVNYASGCSAQRANWPAQQHWVRVITLAAAWSGLNPAAPTSYANDPKLLAAALKGMDWWFANDFTSFDCLGSGGDATKTCPCGTPGMWNTNWFGQVILIPQLASTACLIVSTTNLTDAQKFGCYNIPNRPYQIRDTSIPGVGYLTGANMINVMQNSLSMGLYTSNATIVAETLKSAMGALLFADEPVEDGIHRDGSFLQHAGIIYNGNYGKDLLNAFIQLEGEVIGTSFAANDTIREAFATQVKGSEWMIFVDKETKQQRWDFNVIGRFVAFPTQDLQASADINFNVTKLAAATADFTGANSLTDTVKRLKSNGSVPLVGNKGFWSSDYMVHRRDNYILGNKMISNRSHNTEYTNSANPLGYHLGQGTLFSYVTGNEYKDIQAQWDWYLIPGTTDLLRVPQLDSKWTGVTGKRSFVGTVSDGSVGASAMDYIDPHDGSLAFRKAWFYFDDSVLVTTTAVVVDRSVAGIGNAPVISVLDNRRKAEGGISVDGKTVGSGDVTGKTLFYGGNGYLSHGVPFNLTLDESTRSGNWSAISTSTAGVNSADIFSAYTTTPATTYSYQFFPATSKDKLAKEATSPSVTPIDVNGTLGAAGNGRLGLIFWPGSASTVTVDRRTIGWGNGGQITINSPQPATYLFSLKGDQLAITVSDPSQTLTSVSFTITATGGNFKCPGGTCTRQGNQLTFTVALPTGGFTGSSVIVKTA